MNRFAKSAIAAVAGFAATAVPLAQANADGWGRPRGPWHDDRVIVRHHHRGNDALVGGLIGLTAGLIIMDTLNRPRPAPVYRTYPQTVYDYPPAPAPRVIQYREAQSYGLEPWSKAWFRYCSDRYRSFNAETGTYRGYDNRDHFCVAN